MKEPYDQYMRHGPPPHPNDGAWHRVSYEARQTGRTWRMMQEARRLWQEGKKVYIVVRTLEDVQRLRHRYKVPAEVKIEAITLPGVFSLVGNEREPFTVNGWKNCEVLVDPSAIEYRYENYLRHFHRFDGELSDQPAQSFGEWDNTPRFK